MEVHLREAGPVVMQKLMLIDNEKDTADTMVLAFKLDGVIVETFDDPVEAISAFRPSRYALVIPDINLSRMNSFHAFRELRKVDPNVPICLFFTAFGVY